jgi:hypothetical protein
MNTCVNPVGRLLSALIICTLFLPFSANALMRDMDTRALLDKCSRSVVATVESVETRPVEEFNGVPFTFITFRTDQVITGNINDTFTLRLFGGTLGTTEVSSALHFDYQAGQQLLMFLGEDNSDGFPLIFPQGIYQVIPHPMSKGSVVGPSENSAPIAGIQLYRSADESAYKTIPRLIPLEDFVYSLQRAWYSGESPAPAAPLAPANNQ